MAYGPSRVLTNARSGRALPSPPHDTRRTATRATNPGETGRRITAKAPRGDTGDERLVGERLDAEVLPLKIRILRELRRGRLNRDPPADHHELSLGEPRRHTEVLLDQEDGEALLLEGRSEERRVGEE